MFAESIHIFRFKIEFSGVAPQPNITRMDKRLPCFRRLQNDAASELHLHRNQLQYPAWHIVIELLAGGHIFLLRSRYLHTSWTPPSI